MSFATLVVVGDEPELRRALCTMLGTEGYVIREARQAAEALALLRDKRPDLVVVDVKRPGRAGLEVCRKIRRSSRVPIVVLSQGGSQKDKIRGIAAGADEYVVKPFGLDELVARVRSLLRRTGSDKTMPSFVSDDTADLVINSEYRKFTVQGHNIHLSPKEVEVLTYLLANKDRPVTHAELLETVWGPELSRGAHDNLRVVINKIRKKLESDPAHPRYILTEPWVGYRFDSGPEKRNRDLQKQVNPNVSEPVSATDEGHVQARPMSEKLQ